MRERGSHCRVGPMLNLATSDLEEWGLSTFYSYPWSFFQVFAACSLLAIIFVTMERNYILTQEVSQRKMLRMAYEILENNYDEDELILAGIRESGTVVARNIQRMLKEIKSINAELITVTLDKKFPEEVVLNKIISFQDKVVILIDDVSNTGKTLLYALKPFLLSHPKKIQTLVLVERTHTAFPVKPDYVGLSVGTTLQENIFVEVEGDVIKGAWME